MCLKFQGCQSWKWEGAQGLSFFQGHLKVYFQGLSFFQFYVTQNGGKELFLEDFCNEVSTGADGICLWEQRSKYESLGENS